LADDAVEGEAGDALMLDLRGVVVAVVSVGPLRSPDVDVVIRLQGTEVGELGGCGRLIVSWQADRIYVDEQGGYEADQVTAYTLA
jgi:hypothetical protein